MTAVTAGLIATLSFGGSIPALSAQARLPHGPIAIDCNRACLEGLIDQYLAAVVAPMANFNRPSGIEVTEAFRIENGMIRAIEMVGGSVPYHFRSAWEGGLSGK